MIIMKEGIVKGTIFTDSFRVRTLTCPPPPSSCSGCSFISHLQCYDVMCVVVYLAIPVHSLIHLSLARFSCIMQLMK